MRTINEIILHCSATRAGQNFKAQDIDRWHRARGFQGIGYHFVIDLDGTVERGRALEKAGAHCLNHNAHSIGICYIGGLDAAGKPADTRTEAQRAALRWLVRDLLKQHKDASVHGHNEFAAKACPCFDVQKERWS